MQMQMQSWSKTRVLAAGLALLMWGLLAAPAARAVVLQDGAWEVEVDLTTQAGLSRWQDPFGVDHADQVWYWLSFGNTARLPINSAGPLTTTLSDSDGDGDIDSLNALYTGGLLDIVLNQRLRDGGVFSGGDIDNPVFVSTLTGTLTVENTSSDTTFTDLTLWFYTDMELLGTPMDDVLGALLAPNPNSPDDLRLLQVDSPGGDVEGFYESDIEPLFAAFVLGSGEIAFGEGDGFMDFLNNASEDPGGQASPVMNGDLSSLSSLTFDLAPGDSIHLVHTQSLFTPVPEPGTAGMFGLGLLGLALSAPRRRA